MNRWLYGLLFICCCQISAEAPPLQQTPPPATALSTAHNIVPLLSIDGAIGPAISDYLVKEITHANENKQIPLILITLDTPGGLSASLRDINKAILSSDIPIACLVYPQGARAASAGTYILYACHIAAMASATTLGAATPVNIAGPMGNEPNKKDEPLSRSDMEKKVLNDAVAYIRSLAQLRNRNEKWAELAVIEAATLTADEALAKNVINFIAETPQELLSHLDGQIVMVKEQRQQLHLKDATLQTRQTDWRNAFIGTITDPNIAYILMLIGIYGLLLEFYSPGIGIAGITGGIALLIAMYAFQLLPLNFAGAGLIILGICLMVAEAMVPSFGVLGIGGVIAFVFGSIFLFDTEQAQFQVSKPLIAAVAAASAVFLIFSLGYIWRARHNKIVSGQEEIIGALVTVTEDFTGSHGYVIFNGERWAAESDHPLNQGQQARVKTINGLTLKITSDNVKE